MTMIIWKISPTTCLESAPGHPHADLVRVGRPLLSVIARALIEDPSNEIMVSPASFWEIAIKVSKGKLALNQPYGNFIDLCLNQYGFCGLPIGPAHTTQLAMLPFPPGHKDPFDRLLIAQAIVEGIPIVSVDVAFDAYPVRRIW